MVEHRAARRRRSWGQRLVLAGGALSAVALAVTAGGLGYVYRKVERLPRIELSGVLASPEEGGEAQNYLIVGIDDATGIDRDDPLWNERDVQMLSDTIMVLRVDPAERRAQLLSLPRDLWVTYPDGDEARINTAIQRGNGRPDVLIGVLDDYLGIPVHHYVQVNFAGFRDLVDAIDGVPIHFPLPARDRRSGLSVLETGCVTLDPVQALAYARSRHYQELVDEEWTGDPTGDLGRIQRQQAFIRAALDRAVSRGARNPGTLDRLIDVALDSVTVDDELTTGDIFDLAQRFRSFNPTSLETFSVPVVDDTTSAGASIVRLVESEADPILARFRDPEEEGDGAGGDGTGGAGGEGGGGSGGQGGGGVSSDDISPVSVRLTVLNGSGVSGQARETADALATVGFTVVGTGEAETFDHARTTIRYPSGLRAQAELVERWLVAGAELEEIAVPGTGSGAGAGEPDSTIDPSLSSAGIELVTGTDWEGVAAEPRPADSATAASDGEWDRRGDRGGDRGGDGADGADGGAAGGAEREGGEDDGPDDGGDGAGGGSAGPSGSTTSTTSTGAGGETGDGDGTGAGGGAGGSATDPNGSSTTSTTVLQSC